MTSLVDGGALQAASLASVLPITMSSTIYQWPSGVSAFHETSAGSSLVMTSGSPYVQWGFRVERIQQWLVTLEQVIDNEANAGNRHDLEELYFSLKTAHAQHLKEHEAVVTDAPSADDLQAYLTAYTAAMGQAAIDNSTPES
jgi:hypothetical protein